VVACKPLAVWTRESARYFFYQFINAKDKKIYLLFTQVTDRVNEVDDHLNFLLGRLSLVVQEFNQVRGGLGEALESLRSGLIGQQQSSTSAKSPPYSLGSDSTDPADVTVITRKEPLENSSDE
jgi:hypothetical protein